MDHFIEEECVTFSTKDAVFSVTKELLKETDAVSRLISPFKKNVLFYYHWYTRLFS